MYLLTYYTPDVPLYVDAVTLWIDDCFRLVLDHQVFARPSHGVRARNCLEKLYVIRDAAEQHGLPLLWVDADSRILRRPSFDAEGADFVARQNLRRPEAGFAGSVLYFADTDAARELIRRCCAYADSNPHLADEGCIREAVFGMLHELRFRQLPERCFAGYADSSCSADDPTAEILISISSQKVRKLMPMRRKGATRKVNVPAEFVS